MFIYLFVWFVCLSCLQAPLTEEIVYRACMIPLLVPSLGLFWAVLICPLLFGVGKTFIVLLNF